MNYRLRKRSSKWVCVGFWCFAVWVPQAGAQSIHTVAGGFLPSSRPAISISVGEPGSVFADKDGNLFIACPLENFIARVDVSGRLSVFAGNGGGGNAGDGGPATSAQLRFPSGLAVDAAGDVYIADTANDRIRRVDAKTGTITTVAGNGAHGYAGDGGPATRAQLRFPYGVALDPAGDIIIADTFNNVIRRVDHSTGIISTVAGNGISGHAGDGGLATSAELSLTEGVAVDAAGNIFVADYYASVIRRVDAVTGIITTVAGIRVRS